MKILLLFQKITNLHDLLTQQVKPRRQVPLDRPPNKEQTAREAQIPASPVHGLVREMVARDLALADLSVEAASADNLTDFFSNQDSVPVNTLSP